MIAPVGTAVFSPFPRGKTWSVLVTDVPVGLSCLPAKSVVLAGLLASTLPACGGSRVPDRPAATVHAVSRPAEPPKAGYAKPYAFTSDWFSADVPSWSQTLGPLRGRADLQYLEIGVYEGRSLLWVLENVLTDPTSHLTGIDVKLRPRLLSNLELSGHADRVTLIEGPSQVELRRLPLRSFDVVYIDGSHVSADVLSDAVQSFELLKDGGLMIFDDYTWVGAWVTMRGLLPDQLRPRMAIDAFLEAYRYDAEVVLDSYQMILRKVSDPCRTTEIQGRCSPFGQYMYDWSAERLLRSDDPSRATRISSRERDLIESILRSRGLDAQTRSDPDYVALSKRLDLEL
jgi:predicted O-methyltransferase YrrM